MNPYDDFIEIPELFHSFETGKPIARCGLCDRDLMEPGTRYVIEKAFKNAETVFEHAVCLDCHSGVMEEMSEESTNRINQYFAERVDAEARPDQCREAFENEAQKWVGHCLIKGYPLQECDEYQLYGLCVDRHMVLNGFPYMLSGEVIDEIIELLSEQTLGLLGELSEKLFGIDAPKDLLIF